MKQTTTEILSTTTTVTEPSITTLAATVSESATSITMTVLANTTAGTQASNNDVDESFFHSLPIIIGAIIGALALGTVAIIGYRSYTSAARKHKTENAEMTDPSLYTKQSRTDQFFLSGRFLDEQFS
ncbi:MAG: hypothetical protein MRQ09_03970, partial [Candidatus Midichloria sp.]|nr:hypothetical protein [Candidatus Midichloria sp.]